MEQLTIGNIPFESMVNTTNVRSWVVVGYPSVASDFALLFAKLSSGNKDVHDAIVYKNCQNGFLRLEFHSGILLDLRFLTAGPSPAHKGGTRIL